MTAAARIDLGDIDAARAALRDAERRCDRERMRLIFHRSSAIALEYARRRFRQGAKFKGLINGGEVPLLPNWLLLQSRDTVTLVVDGHRLEIVHPGDGALYAFAHACAEDALELAGIPRESHRQLREALDLLRESPGPDLKSLLALRPVSELFPEQPERDAIWALSEALDPASARTSAARAFRTASRVRRRTTGSSQAQADSHYTRMLVEHLLGAHNTPSHRGDMP